MSKLPRGILGFARPLSAPSLDIGPKKGTMAPYPTLPSMLAGAAVRRPVNTISLCNPIGSLCLARTFFGAISSVWATRYSRHRSHTRDLPRERRARRKDQAEGIER